jgi:hypothetical protein
MVTLPLSGRIKFLINLQSPLLLRESIKSEGFHIFPTITEFVLRILQPQEIADLRANPAHLS